MVINQETNPEPFSKAEKIRNEYVVAVRGVVSKRPEGTINPELATGEVEILAHELRILNASETPPFDLTASFTEIGENVRLRYRYLDLRRPSLQQNLMLRSQVVKIIRDYLYALRFNEIETPFLTKSTPEGARDYIVPSRVNQEGEFYALPQSPQLFKQLLMVSGYDRYYQIARCFRDEDLRADRQPEFTQIDLEMSFVHEEDVFQIIEGMISQVFCGDLRNNAHPSIPRLTYDEAIGKYGVDKPDIRFGMTCHDVTEIVKDSHFQVFSKVIAVEAT